MAVLLKITCLCLLAIISVQSSVLPVEKCTLTDKSCMIPAFQKMIPVFMAGMPQYDVEVLDPMTKYNMEYELDGLQFTLSDGTLTGLKNVVVSDVEWDTSKKTFVIEFSGDYLVEGNYKAGGKVLDEPISGEGKVKIDMNNMFIKLVLHYDLDNGHIKLGKSSFEFDLKDNGHFDLTNLYNGDKPRGDNMLKLLNDNWKQIFVAFGKPLVNAGAERVYKNVDSFFKKLPLADIAYV